MSGQLTVKHLHRNSLGYGRFAIDLITGLNHRGFTVFDGIEGDPNEQIKEVVPGATDHVLWMSIPSHARGWLTGQHIHCFTMWEATVLPEGMREEIHLFDTILVPSRQNQELFARYHDNVQYCPLAVDTDKWFYTAREEPKTVFNFMVAGSGARKGPDVAFHAFAKAFPDWDRFAPWLSTISGYIDDDDEIALYDSVHCMVAPSRGEGFGLQPMQAMAQGTPTILTDAHGHAAFAHLGWPVAAKLEQAGLFMMGDAGDWWEPDVNDVADAMREIYEGYDVALERAYLSSQIVAKEFSVDAFTERVLDILPADLGPYTGTGEWFVPDSHKRLYYVKTNRKVKAEIAGEVLLLEEGEETYLSADQKRVLFDLGGLDPECVETELYKKTGEWIDTGVTEAQLIQHKKNQQGERVCLTCGQIIGSGVQLSDKLFAESEARAATARIHSETARADLC
jgi:hypothetical protein